MCSLGVAQLYAGLTRQPHCSTQLTVLVRQESVQFERLASLEHVVH